MDNKKLSVADKLRDAFGGPPKTHPCFHAKFGRFALKNVGINTGKQRKLGSIVTLALSGWESWLVPRHMPFQGGHFTVRINSPTFPNTSSYFYIAVQHAACNSIDTN